MKIRNLVLVTTLITSLFGGSAMAEPKNGFSLNAGSASHSRTCNTGCATSTSGLSLGLDYQFALSNNFSINPFLMSSSESVQGFSTVTAGHGILGAQLRYWAGDIFIGAHVGSYSEVFASSGTSLTATGSGSGLVIGWEKPDGGLYVMGQLDKANVTNSGVTVPITGVRLSAGYRWK